MDYSKQMDYSSLSTYLSCPRKFFFKYILCLQKDGVPSIDLIFGSCWHFGMECAYRYLKANPDTSITQLTEVALEGFNAMWNRDAAQWFYPDATFPKSPNRARDMYYKYFDMFMPQDRGKKIIGIEEPFALHISEDLPIYIGRMDLVLEDESGNLEIHEHKTSKFNSPIIFTGYEVSLQTEGYLTVGHIYYDALPRIMYNQSLCQKTKVDHTRYPITKNRHAIERFLSDYRFYMLQIQANMRAFEDWMERAGTDAYEKTAIMPCFYRNAGYACTMYFRPCEYLDLCQMRNNPMTFGERPPQGFTVDEWHPDKHDVKNADLLKEVFGNTPGDTSDQAEAEHLEETL